MTDDHNGAGDFCGFVSPSEVRRRRWDRQRLSHSPILQNGWPIDLPPLKTIDPLLWHDVPVPERRWIVPDLVPEGSVTLLAGDGGHGETLLTLQLLVACVIGKTWLGHPVRRCKAVGVFCEDDRDEIHRRLADVLRHYDASFGDLEDLTLLSRVADGNLLMTFPDQWGEGEPTAFFSQLERLTREGGAQLLVLDSLHDVFGGNENIVWRRAVSRKKTTRPSTFQAAMGGEARTQTG